MFREEEEWWRRRTRRDKSRERAVPFPLGGWVGIKGARWCAATEARVLVDAGLSLAALMCGASRRPEQHSEERGSEEREEERKEDRAARGEEIISLVLSSQIQRVTFYTEEETWSPAETGTRPEVLQRLGLDLKSCRDWDQTWSPAGTGTRPEVLQRLGPEREAWKRSRRSRFDCVASPSWINLKRERASLCAFKKMWHSIWDFLNVVKKKNTIR